MQLLGPRSPLVGYPDADLNRRSTQPNRYNLLSTRCPHLGSHIWVPRFGFLYVGTSSYIWELVPKYRNFSAAGASSIACWAVEKLRLGNLR